jgi:hypothetical protein
LIALLTGSQGGCFLRLYGQEHNPNYDLKKFHMGFSIVGNYAKFKVTPAEDFISRDSVKAINTDGFPGFGLGGIANFRLGNQLDFRLLPQLTFAQRNMVFEFTNKQDKIQVETVSFDLPMLFKYKSVRFNNTRFYVIGGGRVTHDFASNQDAERGPFKPLIALKRTSYHYEFGFGFDFYLIFAKFSPEIKMTNSINNMLSDDPYIYSSSVNRIQGRMFQISLHFE